MEKKAVDKYTFCVEWSEKDKSHVSRCLEFPSVMAHGKSPEAALKEIRTAVFQAIQWMEEEGETIPEPLGLRSFKGNLTLRVSSDVHRQLAIRAADQRVSVNQYILSKIA
jgi:predicted HicB family RNase H-like nuclease